MSSNQKMPIIILQKDDNEKYKYKGIEWIEDETIPEDYRDKSVIYEFDSYVLAKLKDKSTFPIRGIPESDQDEFMILKPENELYEALIAYYTGTGVSEEDARKALQEVLSESAQCIRPFELSKDGDQMFANIGFKKETEQSTKSDNKEQETEVTQSKIDVDSIDVHEIAKKIKKKVIAQDPVVDTLVNNIYNNQKVIESGLEASANSVILIDGPTGTGKTLILKEIANEMKIPINRVSSTSYSAAGYEGLSLTGILEGLLKAADGDLETAQRGIVVLDEFDKLAGNGDTSLEMKKAVQQELLTYLSGATFPITYNGKTYDFDTSKVTFVCMGAFTDLSERKIRESKDGTYTMQPEDYIEEGLMRELVGRISLVTATRAFKKEDLKKILLDSEISPLKDLEKTAEVYKKELVYSDEIVDKIVEEAFAKNTGARALTVVASSIKNVLLPQFFDKDGPTTIEITPDILDKAREHETREVIKR